jgi:hypothetical protein
MSGHASHINYCKDYYKYLHWLRKGLKANRKPVTDLFKEWNTAFFRERITKGKSKEAEANFNDALDALDEAEEATDEDLDEERDEDRESEGSGGGSNRDP